MRNITMVRMGVAAIAMAANTDAAPGQEVGRKLSIRELGFDKETLLKTVMTDTGANHFLGRFMGVATGIKPYKIKEGERAGETAFGIMGEFEAVNSDGESKTGTLLYLPGYVNDAVVNAFSVSDDVQAIRLAYDVYARYDAKAITSYVFTVRDLLNNGSAGVEEVKTQIQALPMPPKTLALAAPEAAKK